MSRLLLGFAVLLAAVTIADDKSSTDQKEQLSKLQPLVGQWRGVGQPQRSSTKDNWIAEADWAWSFDKDGPSLVAKLLKAKYFSRLRLTAATDGFMLLATPISGEQPLRYAGKLDDQAQLVLIANDPRENYPTR